MLNKRTFGDIQVQCEKAKEQLLRLQMEIQTCPNDIELYKAEDRAIAEHKLWQHRIQSFMIQKTKKDWLNLGDSNDRYFHEKLKQRHYNNGILAIQMTNGEMT